ncbi:hypothetical protein BC828DRAFT_17088 [Blastocladiella britannica]|nr:hypothetical protein BC828DRAFT_17088 [Blastocladiella britannica]
MKPTPPTNQPPTIFFFSFFSFSPFLSLVSLSIPLALFSFFLSCLFVVEAPLLCPSWSRLALRACFSCEHNWLNLWAWPLRMPPAVVNRIQFSNRQDSRCAPMFRSSRRWPRRFGCPNSISGSLTHPERDPARMRALARERGACFPTAHPPSQRPRPLQPRQQRPRQQLNAHSNWPWIPWSPWNCTSFRIPNSNNR